MSTDDSHRRHLGARGDFIRSQRRLAKLSLHDLAERTQVSHNPYLNQIKRGVHEPSVRVGNGRSTTALTTRHSTGEVSHARASDPESNVI